MSPLRTFRFKTNPLARFCIRLLIGFLSLAIQTQPLAGQQTPTSQPGTLPEDMVEFWAEIRSRPEDLAIACMPLNKPSQTVLYNADQFPLASVSKLLIFIEYAIRVDEGRIPLDEKVSIAQLERYIIPGTDRGAHDRFMKPYTEDTVSINLFDLAAVGMMQYSSNAASDYLLDRMAPIDWDSLFERLFLNETDHPHALNSLPLIMNNHLDGRANSTNLLERSITLGETYLHQYVNNSDWRTAEIDYRKSLYGRGPNALWPSWTIQAQLLQDMSASSNVNDLRKLMKAIYGSESPLSANVRFMVRTALRWRNNEFINLNYSEYGSKLGFYSGGVITLVAYGKTYAGDEVITVILLRNLPMATYNAILRQDRVGTLTHWMNFNACQGLDSLIARLYDG
ncbi:hypothetical protein MASR2M15_12630 [Anaerolineales bacterium]